MKKYVLVLIVMLSVSFLSAQEFKAKIIGGATASQIDGDSYGGFDLLRGCGGMAVSYPLSENLWIQPEAIFYMRGSRAPSESLSQFRITTNYLDINALAVFNVAYKVGIEGGFGYGVLINAKHRGQYGTVFDMPTAYKGTWNWMAGATYRPSDKMEFYARFLHSLLPATTDNYWHKSLSGGIRVNL